MTLRNVYRNYRGTTIAKIEIIILKNSNICTPRLTMTALAYNCNKYVIVLLTCFIVWILSVYNLFIFVSSAKAGQ